ncbi:hypothetical protein jhhlp_002679 [Lomentospora prolificans]|uniref:Uncharacterized protein n=1 Tax=Lomentospora prolificans TaxID=41688 RepID=A0A2N3NET7_9PEZI|nr:hypothetical protein jhhlp_002679 [Lomentospora prolificans]
MDLGDALSIAKVAWEVYNYGWAPELRASTNYASFGSEVRHLAENLDLLANVVHRADKSLRENGGRAVDKLRWDPNSLSEIIGDYVTTLRECHELLEDNNKFGAATNNPLRNIEWNSLVQGRVDRLRTRIQMHSVSIQTVLKPFEIDLLSRVHEDLSRRIGAVYDEVREVRHELRCLIGVLVPDLKTALDEKAARSIHLLAVPPNLELEFEDDFVLHSACQVDQFPPLRDMADTFIHRLDKSTVEFKPGLTVHERIPPVVQYLNLLKCVFLMGKMKQSPELQNAYELSHWPSYVMELENKLSEQCERFSRGLIAPSLDAVDGDMLDLWVEEAPKPLIEAVTSNVMMEELVNVPLFSASPNVSKKLRLLRHMGSHDERFRLVISAVERPARGAPRQEHIPVDFDIRSSTLNPVYALSNTFRPPFEMILSTNNQIFPLAFCTLGDALEFQQGVTGFKVVDDYCQTHTTASFVVEGQGGSLIEEASVQLWLHRRIAGSLVTDSAEFPSLVDRPMSISNPSSPRVMSPSFTLQSPVVDYGSPSPLTDARTSDFPLTSDFGRMSLSSSPGQIHSPVMGNGHHQTQPHSSPLPSAPYFPSTNIKPASTVTSFGPLSTSPAQETTASSRKDSLFSSSRWRKKSRGFSMSSRTTTTTAASTNTQKSTSSSASEGTVTIINGAGRAQAAFFYTKPLKPLLVLFTQNTGTGQRGTVVVAVDEKTIPNPQRCWCQQGTAPTGGPCKITAIEQSEGAKHLEARRLHNSTGEWDLLPLAAARRTEVRGLGGAQWKGLNRLSILFQQPEARLLFGGTFCKCPHQTQGQVLQCMGKGHLGLLGQVRTSYRNQRTQWYNSRYKNTTHIVNRSLNEGPGKLGWDGLP